MLVEREKIELDERVKDLSVKLEMTKQRESLLTEDKGYLKRINTELQQKNGDLDKINQGKIKLHKQGDFLDFNFQMMNFTLRSYET